MKFNELNLSADLLAEIEKAGFVEASPIQEQTIPLALEGKDVSVKHRLVQGKLQPLACLPLKKSVQKKQLSKPWSSLQLVNSLSKVRRNSSALVVVRESKSAQYMVDQALKTN